MPPHLEAHGGRAESCLDQVVGQRVFGCGDAVDLANRGHHYPAELSGGEQQRVAIARAFANSPTILLADEPTGNLDSKNGRHIFELMQGMHNRNRVTLVLVTHDAGLASEAERRIILQDGRVVSDELKG